MRRRNAISPTPMSPVPSRTRVRWPPGQQDKSAAFRTAPLSVDAAPRPSTIYQSSSIPFNDLTQRDTAVEKSALPTLPTDTTGAKRDGRGSVAGVVDSVSDEVEAIKGPRGMVGGSIEESEICGVGDAVDGVVGVGAVGGGEEQASRRFINSL
ncbi:hypothetical protein VC83_02851 [Pseudogymnoascus destructans]|uniref:Uncharacterized protein n=2 Tax=Pseudogymnoascus destructans TaxID=655981 RepID=L8FVG6_PSED2|nr:uncharacterized protein VC83_02851 [Pseudogymnoascus destructans]ELR04965.1 hypothetical protein GMDG_00222 [Pseudogymnoascus destructans 20631-21]OAF60101.1 hypothetical protein VC83_02851 [Pseudogymnoascus destructans]